MILKLIISGNNKKEKEHLTNRLQYMFTFMRAAVYAKRVMVSSCGPAIYMQVDHKPRITFSITYFIIANFYFYL